MITIHFETTDLENIRFAYSPLIELSASYKVLKNPDQYGLHMAWVEETKRAIYGLDLPFMDALILSKTYIADFLTPTPSGIRVSFEDEIEWMRATPIEVIRQNVEMVIRVSEDSEVRQFFLTYPREAVECLIDELRLYWGLALAHYWGRIQSVLEGDVLYRARAMALHGVEPMLDALDPVVRYQNGAIHLEKDPPYHAKEHWLRGRGMQLVPIIFRCKSVSWQIVPEWQPMIIYGARGAGLWHSYKLPDPEEALVVALGGSKAKMLHALRDPAHTSELAHKLNLTAGAVSQQLSRLNQAGLVESHRSSNRVYYRLTPRGERLLDIFTH